MSSWADDPQTNGGGAATTWLLPLLR
ncbi:Protein of unknown function [Propionibacterium freudenreichii]|nr:Protein of unknown function [Propionibacterium freudenreichii]